MKKVLIYGDSNVWGDNFITGVRIPDDKQWPIILQKKLNNKYIVLQEGLPGRIAGNEEVTKKYKNGMDNFISTFRTNAPVDDIVIMLGTNDLQLKYNKSSDKIISDLLWYKKTVEEEFADVENQNKYFKNKMPNFIYILPIPFDYEGGAFGIFDSNSDIKRKQIISYFENEVSDIKTIKFDDISLFEDGIHLDYCAHEIVADKIAGVLNEEVSYK